MVNCVHWAARGGCILIPVMSHFHEAGLILRAVLHVLSYVCMAHSACVVFALWDHIRKIHEFKHLVQMCELIAISVLFTVAPPVTAFAVYFCAFHLVQHLVNVNFELSEKQQSMSVRLQLQALVIVFMPALITLLETHSSR